MTKTQQPAVFYINAALFDCDGTLVNSTGAISEFWRDFGKTRPHVDPEEIIRTSHGCRTYDVIAKWSPADADVEQVTAWEGAIPDTLVNTPNQFQVLLNWLNLLINSPKNKPKTVNKDGLLSLLVLYH